MSESNDNETSADYGSNDEEYDGPELQVVTEEDHLLPKREYLSAAFALSGLNSRASVFDDEDYDEQGGQEKEHVPVEKSFDSEEREPVVLKEENPVKHEKEASILGNKNQMDTGDVQEELVVGLSEATLDEKRVTPLPTLYLEDDGMVILQFSEIFAIQEPQKKRQKREIRCITYRDKYISMDISELIEDDEEVLLKSHGRIDTHGKKTDQIQLDVPLPIRERSQLVKSGIVRDTTSESREFTKLGRDSCIVGELLKQDLKDDNSSLCQSQLTMEVFPLDQQEWEHLILWETSPQFSANCCEGFKSGLESEGMLVQVRASNSVTEQESLNVMNSGGQTQGDNNNMLKPFFVNPLESFGSRGSQSTNESTNKSRHHPQLLRLESQWDEDHYRENRDAGLENLKQLNSDARGRLSGLALQDRDMWDDSWLDSIIWESDKDLSRSKLIFDLQDEQMIFEVPNNKERKYLQVHAGSRIVSRSSKSKDGSFQEGCRTNSGWQFNISNDKFYMNGKSAQKLQGNAKKSTVHSLRVFHSAPAIKLQTMKIKLSNKERANFHRPKALWYPHDNELAIKQQKMLPTQGSMKIVVKSLGGKGSLLTVGREESVSSLKAKASRKLDFKETEAVKMFYMGKELEDEKSLAEQNVQPNSLVHLLRTKVHLWPWAQKLPGENKSLRPPGAFKKKSDLSNQDGHVFLMEYCEERPLMLSNAGMGANLCTYYQKSSPEDQHGNLLRNQSDTLGSVIILEHGNKSPFLGEIHGGCSQSCVETNMYKAPVFPHRLQSTDYLLVRSAKGKLSLRRINKIVAVGQQVCSYESMLAGLFRLKHLGITRFTLPASISTALAQLPDERIAAASHIARELQITPWNLSSSFVTCATQGRENIERLEITGVGDPSGRGLGFSYVRVAPKSSAASEHKKKKAAACRGVPTVTGTDADPRRLSMEAAREVLLKFNVPDEIIAKQTQRHRTAMIRKISSEQAASGGKVGPTTVGMFSRGQRMSFLQLQQQAREMCQEIWDRQRLSLSACDGDGNESENEANSDLDSFVGDLEDLLDAEDGGEGEESNKSMNEKLDGVKGLKMRRWPSQVEKDEEIEDEAAEYVELCRLLMQDENDKKKKKLKNVGEGIGSFPPPRSNFEPFIDKKYIATEPDASFLIVNESTVKHTKNVDKATSKAPKDKQVKEIGTPICQMKKILKENQKVFMEKKTARANFVCGACGQHGHMKTNKHCPKYRRNTESQPESMDMKKSTGKPSSSDLSGEVWLTPMENKKPAPKSATKFSVNEATKVGDSTSKTPGSSDVAAVSDIDSGTKLTSRKLKISSKENPKASKVESDSSFHSLMPAYSRERGESELHNPSVSGQLLPSTETDQAASSRYTTSVPQPSLSIDKDQAESCRPHRVIWPPTEKEHSQKKLVIKRLKEITDHDSGSLEETPQFESRKTKRMAELADFQRQQRLRLSENFLDWGPKEDRKWRKEQDISTELHREGKVRRAYDDSTVSEERSEIAESRRYREVIRSEREEEKRQKAKQKKKLQRGILENYPPRRNDGISSESGQNINSLCVSDFERNRTEYAPQPKRRQKGQVGLANILESIVDTLRVKEVNVSYLFLKPVTKKEAPNYLEIVKCPMDLSTIRDKVRRMEYRDRQQFRHDVWQIKFNAHLYNDGRNLSIPPLADELLVKCDRLLDEYRDELKEAEKGIVDSSDSLR
ncbi:Bromodomain [Arabidopsis suecica]|uniref:Bromodomain n=1 Tax=Arabidopsis suecica TaxID=45249 RepID=A0A8T2F9Y3_ARASU|nr:Bromodomain [Arabidopsis suecica]